MFLKDYQIKVVGELKRLFQTARETKGVLKPPEKPCLKICGML